ncbi:MAG: SMI1/KNR4 family protein [Gemmataceae bacterium]
MEALLAELRDYVAAHPQLCFFRPGATVVELDAAESTIGFSIPADYRLFLKSFNGGFISLVGRADEPDWDESTARWNSNTLFGAEELAAQYRDQRTIWEVDLKWPGRWPYLPFCHTSSQELLVFGPNGGEERPVLDAFHEVGPDEWGLLYPNFEDLLRAYLSGNGDMQIISGLDDE